jgi:MFS family permease
MAIYFFAMYMLGASMGPVVTGWLSDFFARRAARFSGIAVAASSSIPEQFRAQGLQQAMFVIPILSLVLAAVLFMGAARARNDIRSLETWMKTIGADHV